MKKFLLVSALIGLGACSKDKSMPIQYTMVSVIDDLTDPDIALRPNADIILNFFDFAHYKRQAAHLELTLLTDRKFNPVEILHLADSATTEKNNINDDPKYRDKLVIGFYSSTKKMVDEFHTHYSTAAELNNSECFATISMALEKLAHSPATKKACFVYSDLMENTPYFSCYTSENLLTSNPAKVAQILSKHRYLPHNLGGIQVYFIYQPRNRSEDERFYAMVGIYSLILEPKGAKIYVQADNNIHYE